jgi:hypothetical protein
MEGYIRAFEDLTIPSVVRKTSRRLSYVLVRFRAHLINDINEKNVDAVFSG